MQDLSSTNARAKRSGDELMSKNRWLSVFIVSLAIVLCLLFLVGTPVEANGPIYLPVIQSSCSTQRWQYTIFGWTYSNGKPLEAILDQHGDLGWELVDIYGDNIIFKRPKYTE